MESSGLKTHLPAQLPRIGKNDSLKTLIQKLARYTSLVYSYKSRHYLLMHLPDTSQSSSRNPSHSRNSEPLRIICLLLCVGICSMTYTTQHWLQHCCKKKPPKTQTELTLYPTAFSKATLSPLRPTRSRVSTPLEDSLVKRSLQDLLSGWPTGR